MECLHDMLKSQPPNKQAKKQVSEELGRRYSKIGISAVAAATQFNATDEAKATSLQAPADRSSARGWSRHR